MKYAYYPGCSLARNARAYHQSTLAVAERLGLELEEIDDWNCCGATEYVSVDLLGSYALSARNLALASGMGPLRALVAPCSACYVNLHKTDRYMSDSPALAAQVNAALAAGGMMYRPGDVAPKHLLEVIVDDVGIDAIADLVTRPLKGLRVIPYYGCLVVRPEGYDNPEYPTSMDRLLEALGAEVVDFTMKAACCGGHMTQIRRETALEVLQTLVRNATGTGGHLMATVCPMCQLNVDAYQSAVNREFGTDYQLPVLYFTQLMGLAFGMSETELGIGTEFVSARAALDHIGKEEEGDKKPKKKRRDKAELPMPALTLNGGVVG